MEIKYKSKQIEKLCTDFSLAQKKYGVKMAIKLHMRINEIVSSENFEFMIMHKIGRCHKLKGDRKEQFALDLVQPYRLILEKEGDIIQVAEVIEIIDYH